MKVRKDRDPPPRGSNRLHRCADRSEQKGKHSQQRSTLGRTGPGWCSRRFWPAPVPLLRGKSVLCGRGDMTPSLRVVQESLKQCGGCRDTPCLPSGLQVLPPSCWDAVGTQPHRQPPQELPWLQLPTWTTVRTPSGPVGGGRSCLQCPVDEGRERPGLFAPTPDNSGGPSKL